VQSNRKRGARVGRLGVDSRQRLHPRPAGLWVTVAHTPVWVPGSVRWPQLHSPVRHLPELPPCRWRARSRSSFRSSCGFTPSCIEQLHGADIGHFPAKISPGVIAQLGERRTGSAEVGGSIPPGSTRDSTPQRATAGHLIWLGANIEPVQAGSFFSARARATGQCRQAAALEKGAAPMPPLQRASPRCPGSRPLDGADHHVRCRVRRQGIARTAQCPRLVRRVNGERTQRSTRHRQSRRILSEVRTHTDVSG
jgi:hypothetical protein